LKSNEVIAEMIIFSVKNSDALKKHFLKNDRRYDGKPVFQEKLSTAFLEIGYSFVKIIRSGS
jgi:hypothetical protein